MPSTASNETDTQLRARLVGERATAFHEAARVLKEAETAGQTHMTQAQTADYEKHSDRIDEIDARVKELDESEQRQKAAELSFTNLRATPRVRTAAGGSQQDRELADQFRTAIVENSRAPIEIELPARSGFQPGIEARDLATTTASGLVPTGFHNQLIAHMTESAAVLSAGATVLTTGTGEPLVVPKSTARSTAAIVAEAGTISESDPTLGKTTLNAFKYGFLVQVSYELAEDEVFDLLGYLARQAGEAIGLGLGADLVTGDGTDEPNGVVTASTLGVTGATGTDPTADELIDLMHSVASPYARQPSSGWLMSTHTLGVIRKLKGVRHRRIRVPVGHVAGCRLGGHPARTAGVSGCDGRRLRRERRQGRAVRRLLPLLRTNGARYPLRAVG
ncbi:MAG: phage major capsid protein [Pseudonocardiaceae bacterium]|nr:phage major capsid protein [Pseudonocardiaceae bacterium]